MAFNEQNSVEHFIIHQLIGLISDDYQVLIYPRLKDHYPTVGIQQFNGQELKLPSDSRFYPSLEKLAEHRRRFAL